MQSSQSILPSNIQTSQYLMDQPNINGIDIVFKNISYNIKVIDETSETILPFNKKYKQKQILHNVSGIFKAGKMTAIMGASGAGKTTLLNILACRIKYQEGGQLFANNIQYRYKTFRNFANYVMQTDRLMQTLTVRETLEFAAKLKLSDFSQSQRKIKVIQLVENMKLQKCLDTLVGGVILKGISGGEKKRTSIAFELISDPQVIFLDEPTSGLDSLTSYIICSELRKLAHNQNKTVIMTIHQPGMETFGLFDDLLVLLEGKLMYQNKASMITEYFEKHFNLKCPQYMNPPDYFMMQIHYENEESRDKFKFFFQTYNMVENPLVYQKITQKQMTQLIFRQTSVPFLSAISALINRSFINTKRNPHIIHAKLFQASVMALYSGGIFFNFGKKDYLDYQSWLSISGFFFIISVASLTMSIPPIALTFPQQRLVFLKQQDNRMYTTAQYFIAKNIVQIPQHLVLPLLCIPIYYFMVGCAATPGQFFLHCLICCFMSYCGASIGLFIGSIIMDWKDIPVVIPIFLIPLIAFSGFFKNRADLPGWIGWIQYISPNKYSFIGLLENQVENRDSLIQRLNFNVSKWETVWLMLLLGLAFRLAAFICLLLFRKKSQ